MDLKTSMKRNLIETRFRISLFLLRYGGVPIMIGSISRLRSTYNTLLLICTYMTYSALLLQIILNTFDMKKSFKTIRYFLGFTVVLWLQIYQRFNTNSIVRLLELSESFTWEDLPTRDSVTGKVTMAGWIPRIQNITKITFQVASVSLLIQSALRLINSRDLIYEAWYPFDVTTSPMYQFVVISQIVSTIHFVPLFFSFQNLYATFVCIAGSQLEKLKDTLLKIKQEHTPIAYRERFYVGTEERTNEDKKFFQYMQKGLNECIRHHQMILIYMKTMEESFNFVICGLFLITLISICGSAFSAVMSWGDWMDGFDSLSIYFFLMVSVYIYCSFGNNLTEQAESVKHAAMGCDWVGTPVSFQRCIVFMIAASNKEFTLTAGKFVAVSNETMMNIVNQSMSFFMFLLQMKNRNDEIQLID